MPAASEAEGLSVRVRGLLGQGARGVASVLLGVIALDRPAPLAQTSAVAGSRLTAPPSRPAEPRSLGEHHRATQFGLDATGALVVGMQFGTSPAALTARGLVEGSHWQLDTALGAIVGVVKGCGPSATLELLSADRETPFGKLFGDNGRYTIQVGPYTFMNSSTQVVALNELRFKTTDPEGPAFGIVFHADGSGYSVRWTRTAGIDPGYFGLLHASVAFIAPYMLSNPPAAVEDADARRQVGPLVERLRLKAGMQPPPPCDKEPK